MVGIIAAGAYVPIRRLQRSSIAEAHAWFAPALAASAKGERAMAGWDEDSVTMAVEAARDALVGRSRASIASVIHASTSPPFADRQNAVLAKEALGLPDEVETFDLTGGQRAGVSALLQALRLSEAGAGEILCLAGEKRRTQPGSELEMTSGDAAAAFLVGQGEIAAEFLGAHSVSIDFVDHFRAAGSEFDYAWESRWVRDEGYGKIAVDAVSGALRRLGVPPGELARFVMSAPLRGVNEAVAKACGIPADRVHPALHDRLGDAGSAQPLVLLADALATARLGDLLVLVGFGQGCDVLLFRATGRRACPGLGVQGWLARRRPETNYVKFIALNGHLALDRGMRAEFDQKTAVTALYRNRRAVLGLVGGRCPETGAVQFPATPIGLDGERRQGEMEPYPFADRLARVVTHTADALTYSPDPPSYYGAIDFEGGGRMTVEFADAEAEDIKVQAPVRMMFRIKAQDEIRGFTRYFWKAAPDFQAQVIAEAAE